MNIISFIKILVIITPLYGATSYADYELNESMKCLTLFRHYEYKHRIPGDTLYSISLNETGKLHSEKKIKLVWPWTANIEGKGYFFDSKREAVAFVRGEMLKGKESIDVGCMQINLKHHPDAFRNLEQAFDPAANIAYGASFLRSKYDALKDWHKAIAHYHSATEVLGEKYKNNIIKTASNITKFAHPFHERGVKKANITRSIPKEKAKTNNIKTEQEKRYKSNMMIYVPKKSGGAL
jgi:soluble lytic murein transglycosylase-like protein